MTTEDLLVNDSGDRETVETIGKCLPQLDVVTTFTYMYSNTSAFWLLYQAEQILAINRKQFKRFNKNRNNVNNCLMFVSVFCFVSVQKV